MTLRRRLYRFVRDRRAAASVEFVFAFPVLFVMFVVILELCFLMARNTLLQQALEVTMRQVRLGTIVNPSVTELERQLCERMITVSDCQSSMVLEFTRVNTTTFAMPGPQAPCARRSEETLAARAGETYDTGAENELMVVRACLVVDTITPVMEDAFELFARTAFVNEPRD